MEGRGEKVRKLKLTWSTCCLLGQSHKCFDCERNSYSQTTSVNKGFHIHKPCPMILKSNQQLLFEAWIFYVCLRFRCAGVTRGWDDGWMVGLPGI